MQNPIPQATAYKTGKALFPGRTVYYTDRPGLVLVATVILVWNTDGLVNLHVLPNGVDVIGHAKVVTSVPFGRPDEVGTWHHLPQF